MAGLDDGIADALFGFPSPVAGALYLVPAAACGPTGFVSNRMVKVVKK
jgi:hypothetical protein